MLEFFQKLFLTSSERPALEERLLEAKKMEVIGRLSGGVAHDLNNVLAVISGYNDLISAQSCDNPRLLGYTRELQKATDRASALTRQLLAASRRQVTKSRVLDLNETIEDMLEMLRRIAGDEVQVSTHLAAGLGLIKAYPAQIDQVLMNLAVNARDAMSSGGKLAIETANIEVTSTFRDRYPGLEPGAHVMLAISDTGTGMDADTKSRLFEPFFTTKEHDKGTGLGLAIVHEIVKQHGGEIRVCSEPGKGTTMKIYLPVHPATASNGQLALAAAASASA